jgi:hypothetical protein
MTKTQKFGIIATLLVGIFAWFWFLFDAIDTARAGNQTAHAQPAPTLKK